MSRNMTGRTSERFSESFEAADERAKQAYKVLAQSVRDSFVDSVPQWAASVSWFALLSAVPLMLVGGALASFFVEPSWAADRLASILGDFVPQGEGALESKVQDAFAARNRVGLIAFAGLLWTGTRVFDALTRAMNIAFDTDDSYGFFKRLLVEAVMLLTIGVFFILALTSGYLTGILWEAIRFLPAQEGLAYAIVTWLVRAALLVVTFFLIYRFVPRGNTHAPSALIGAVTAAGLFLIANPIFQYYVQRFGNFNAIYGSLAVLIIIMIWIYIASIITLFGGEVTSHAHEMIYQGRSAEEVGRRHDERSPQAKR
jgi:membrane protein